MSLFVGVVREMWLRLWTQEQASGGTVHGDVKFVMGHVFEEHSWRSAKGYCEKCNGVIIAIVQTWRKCSGLPWFLLPLPSAALTTFRVPKPL